MTRTRIAVCLLLCLIVGAHIAMWTSTMPTALKTKLTLINAAGWAVVLLPAWAVARWAAVHKTGQQEQKDDL